MKQIRLKNKQSLTIRDCRVCPFCQESFCILLEKVIPDSDIDMDKILENECYLEEKLEDRNIN